MARGTKINWLYYDCFNDSKERILTFHKNSVVWQYTGLPVIDYRNPNDTASFINQVYPNYIAKKDDFGLDTAIESYLDAKRESGYLETRALRAVVVLEFLRSRYSRKKGFGIMLADWGINLPQIDLERFIQIRNSLVHRGAFLTTEYWKEYSFVLGILDKVFLKILSYEGEFLDITNSFARISTQANQPTT